MNTLVLRNSAAVERLLGKRWERNASGPDRFDCYGLAVYLERELFGRDMLPIVDAPESPSAVARMVAAHPANQQWQRVAKPVDGALVLMAHNLHPWHLGVYLAIDGGLIVHTQRSTGVTCDSPIALRAAGWRSFQYHDWIG